jgi:hypothetical protein
MDEGAARRAGTLTTEGGGMTQGETRPVTRTLDEIEEWANRMKRNVNALSDAFDKLERATEHMRVAAQCLPIWRPRSDEKVLGQPPASD